MQALPHTEQLAAQIRNAAWMVRHYRRPHAGATRAQAIQRLGLTVRAAFNKTEDFEPLLIAVVEGLRPEEYRAPF
jgi:hypothetical protein